MAAKKKAKAEAKAKKEEGPKKLSFFDFLNNINGGTNEPHMLIGCGADPGEGASMDSADKAYVPFMINRGLSYFQDTVLYANEMNRYAALPSRMQYDFYRHGLRPRKRFSKWFKKLDDGADVQLCMHAYECNAERAREIVSILNSDQLTQLRKQYDRGGKC